MNQFEYGRLQESRELRKKLRELSNDSVTLSAAQRVLMERWGERLKEVDMMCAKIDDEMIAIEARLHELRNG